MADKRPSEQLPLAIRLPNAPASFVGRKGELSWLRAASTRAPVTVVVGEGGLGKSALVLAHVHRHASAQVARTIFVTYRASDPNEHAALPLVRALMRAQGVASVDWSELLSAPEGLCALAIDLAEAGPWWVVLDDLHSGGETKGELLQQLSRYARRSRFFATMRATPTGGGPFGLEGQVLKLGALPDADLRSLARILDPACDVPKAKRAAAAAEGSPWRLRESLDGRGGIDGLETKDHGREFVRALARLEVSVPEDVVRQLTPQGEAAPDVSELERHGLVERTAQGVRVHQVARDRLSQHSQGPNADSVSDAHWRVQTATILGARDDAAMQLQALRLLLEAGRIGELRTHLDRSFHALLAGGFAIALWSVLADVDDPALETYRLQVALELGDRDALARVRAPAVGSTLDRLLWASAVLAKGRFAEAIPLAEAAHREAHSKGDRALAFRARFVHAQCLGNLGRLAEALSMLEALDGDELPDLESRARRDGFAAQLLSLLDLPERAIAAADAARRHLFELPWPERGHIGVRVARALYNLGRFRDAEAVLARLSVGDTEGSVRFDVGRTLRFLRACLAHDRGDHERARAELVALEPYVGPTSLLRANTLIARGNVAAMAGDLETLHAVLGELSAMELSAHLAEERAGLSVRGCLLRRKALELAPESTRDTSFFGKLADLHRLRLELHVGARAPAEVLASLEKLLDESVRLHPEQRVMARLIRAEARLAGGDGRGGLADVAATLADAAEHEFPLHEVEARSVHCDVLLVLGDHASLQTATSGLLARARTIPSARLVALAELASALAAPRVDHALLERLATSHATAPEAALRARALLGKTEPIGAVDRVVLEAVRARASFLAPQTFGGQKPGEDWRSGWGIDVHARSVWLPSGARLDLSKQPLLLRIVEELASRGGVATKEELTLSVWQERDYHPLRHDNRLQAAVRKLRQRIEDDASSPRRIVTTEDGYALEGSARLVRALDQSGARATRSE